MQHRIEKGLVYTFTSCLAFVTHGAALFERPPTLSHYREVRRAETDVIVEEADTLFLVEAKSGAIIADDYFAGLSSLEATLARVRERRGRERIVVFGGDAAQHRSDVTVLPWSQIQEPAWARSGGEVALPSVSGTKVVVRAPLGRHPQTASVRADDRQPQLQSDRALQLRFQPRHQRVEFNAHCAHGRGIAQVHTCPGEERHRIVNDVRGAKRAVLAASAALDARVAPESLNTPEEAVRSVYILQDIAGRTMTLFSMVAVALAFVSLHVLVRSIVWTKRKEVAIRTALGAQASGIGRWLLAEMAWPVLVAIPCGALGLWLWFSVMSVHIVGLTTDDLGPVLLILGIALSSAIGATVGPAAWTSRHLPARALQED